VIKINKKNTAGPLSQLLSAATQDVTYIILTDCTCSCPSLSNYTYIILYYTYIILYYILLYYIILYYIILYYIILHPSIRYSPYEE